MLWNKLENPDAKYRPHPFWSWNDKMDKQLCRYEIDEMKKSGAGGFFMHARTGLETEYLSEEWMDITKDCISYASEHGMEAWGYDEDGWPSGFAGGEVQKADPGTVITWIECRPYSEIKKDEELLITFTWDREACDPETMMIVMCKNPGYVDLLNAETTEQFMRLTHNNYKAALSEKEFEQLGGFFTDEPQYKREKIPYSVIIEEQFEKENGYALRNNLPALFRDMPGFTKIRYDYYKLVSRLFKENFTKKLYYWHEKNNLGFTGHFLHEDSLLCQMQGTAGVMPHYEYMTMPGMDWLGRNIGSPLVPKQVSSVAAQTGKKQVLSETFALCGWNISFEELKWMAHWQFVNGVTMICQHLEAYTLRGSRKRDYPPSLFYQQPYWNEYRKLNDYFGRLGQLFSETKEVVRVGVIHPIRSAWAVYCGAEDERIKELDDSLEAVSCYLSQIHLPYHYIDEGILNEKGSATDNGTLCVGDCEYNAVLLPAMYSVDQTTVELLEKFTQNGGLLFSMGRYPRLLEGKECNLTDKIETLVSEWRGEETVQTIRDRNEFSIRIMDETGNEIPDIHVMCRNRGSQRFYFLANLSKDKKWTARIQIENIDYVEIWDGWEYKKHIPDVCRDGKKTSFLLTINAMEAILLSCEKKEEIIEVQNKLYIKNTDMNSVTLDCAEYRIDNGEWQKQKAVIRIMKELLSVGKNVPVELRFHCNIESDPKNLGPIYLVMESYEKYEIMINKKSFIFVPDGFFRDSAFQKADITGYLTEGENEILLKTNFYQNQKVYDVLFGDNVLETEKNKLTMDTELESIYLCGNFGVYSRGKRENISENAYTLSPEFYLSLRQEQLTKYDFTAQGYLFFAGNIELAQSFLLEKKEEKRYILRLDRKPCCAVLVIRVNDVVVRTYSGGSPDTDITDYLEEGKNEIVFCFGGTNRNLLGPHHFIGGESFSVGPDTFGDTGGWTESRELQGKEIWTDSYCFVEFGF